MSNLEIKVYNDGKKKSQSFEVTACFKFCPPNGYGGGFEMTVFGSTEKEATDGLIVQLNEMKKSLDNELDTIAYEN